MNNPNYSYPQPINYASQSIRGSMSSTPSRMQQTRPRFGYAGPPSYPRPRSSASKPNPGSYDESFSSMNDSDSIKNNYGSPNPNLSDFPDYNYSNRSKYDSSFTSNDTFYSCNNTFTSTPQKHKDLEMSVPENNELFSPRNNFGGTYHLPGASKEYDFHSDNFNSMPQEHLKQRFGSPLSNIYMSQESSKPRFGFHPSNMQKNISKSKFDFQSNNFGNTRQMKLGNNFRGRFNMNQAPFDRRTFKKNKMEMKVDFKCELCEITFTSKIPFDMHMQGSKHAKKLKLQNASKTINNEVEEGVGVVKLNETTYRCDLCNIVANSSLQMQTHLDGVKHKNKLQLQQKEEEKLTAENKTDEEINDLAEANEKKVDVKPPQLDIGEENAKTDILQGSNIESTARNKCARSLPEESEDLPSAKKPRTLHCSICDLQSNSEKQLEAHLASKKHKAKLEGKPIPRKNKRKMNVDGDAENTNTESSEKKPATVVGVKTLESSFVQGEGMQ